MTLKQHPLASHSTAQTGQSTHTLTAARSDQWARHSACDTLTEQCHRSSPVILHNTRLKPTHIMSSSKKNKPHVSESGSCASSVWIIGNQTELRRRWGKVSFPNRVQLMRRRTYLRLNCFVISALCKSVDGWMWSSASDTLSPESPRCQAPPQSAGAVWWWLPPTSNTSIYRSQLHRTNLHYLPLVLEQKHPMLTAREEIHRILSSGKLSGLQIKFQTWLN